MMTQNVTDTNSVTTSKKEVVTDPRHQALIDYRAMNGLITDDDGIRKMTVDDLAKALGVDRRQLYRWQDSIPDFWDLVNNRRKEISPKSRLQRVHETWYLKAVKGEWQHMNAWLMNFDSSYVVPTQKVEHEAGQSMVELMRELKDTIEPQAEKQFIEADVTHDTQNIPPSPPVAQ